MPTRGIFRTEVGRGVALLLALGVAGGALVAGISLPAVGGIGVGIVTASNDLDINPADLVEPPLPEKSTVVDANGHQIAQFYDQYRVSVSLDHVADVMKTAIISIEDYRFYEHGPIDIEGTVRALSKNVIAGGVSQGGSSITQQYVKQVLLNKATTKEEQEQALQPSYGRKLAELRYAMGLERKYSKDQILEKYLNIAYFGAGANGIEAAAKRFFGVSASRLNLTQAATLAGAVQQPNSTDPSAGKKSQDRLRARRNTVLDRMAELKKITPEQAAAAKKKPLGYKDTPLPGGCESSKYPYFCMYVRADILTNPAFSAFGKTADARDQFLKRGGLTIKTTLDPKMQAAADKAIKDRVYATDNPVASEALVVPGTGEIKAMAASRKYGTNKRKKQISYNVVANVAHGGGTGFQAGSTFKVFTLLTALKEGWKLNDGIQSPAGYTAPGYAAFKNCKGQSIGDPSHTVTNDEGSGGFKTLQTGTWESVNTFFVSLEQKVGLCNVVKTAKSLGIKRADGQALQEFEGFTLGINEMDPVTVASAYAAIGARGMYCPPQAITSITDRNGKTTTYKPNCKRALDPEVADAAAHILTGVFGPSGTMSAVGGIGRDAAGKTGTSDDSSSAWFAGFTPDLAGAVSLGDPRGAVKHKLNNVTIGGTTYGSVFGADISGRIWKYTMIDALKGIPATDFTPVNTARFGGCGAGCAPHNEEPTDNGQGQNDPGTTPGGPIGDPGGPNGGQPIGGPKGTKGTLGR
ncbi:transglycosylase domain-containing protein [Planotetraspora phitsanulokensis]|uniref:Carboxypeptidase n=1 Tax=Planotetraspora phitsanulokensis TaxID=575192 RepID=A0A8J3UFY2_9ACTN|nr:transglycosylase domain-containing protein [Planotetraspora phitsanulokensis]GII42586.1 carboxypeptidase [Planotetraspora phitsanulokensis]